MGKNKGKKNQDRTSKSTHSQDTKGKDPVHARTGSTTATSFSSATAASASKPPQFNGSSALLTEVSKRDSVISSTWGDSKHDSEPWLEPLRRHRWRRTICGWWPCRFFRWVSDAITAIVRAFRGPQRADVFLTGFLIAICVFVGYSAVDLLCRMIQTAAAQDVDVNCSVVYVTIPVPVITVSLIGASPSNTFQDTSSFSLVDRTTQWLYSIVPPNQISTLNTLSLPTAFPSPEPSIAQSDGTTELSSTLSSSAFSAHGVSLVGSEVSETSTMSTPSPGEESTAAPFFTSPALLISSISAYPSPIGQTQTLWSSSILTNNNFATFSSNDFSYISPAGVSSWSSLAASAPMIIPLNSVLGLTSSLNGSRISTSGSSLLSASTISGSTTFVIQTRLANTTAPNTSAISKSDSFTSSLSRTPLTPFATPARSLNSISKTTSIALNQSFLATAITSLTTNVQSSPVLASPLSVVRSASSITPMSKRGNFNNSVPLPIQPDTDSNASLFIAASGTEILPEHITNGSNRLHARDLASRVTRIISYGSTAVRFIFPPRQIITTASYWTGMYPTATGPLPSDLATLVLSTRSIPQTPLSALSSLPLVTSSLSPSTIMTQTSLGEFEATPTAPSISEMGSEPATGCGEYGNFTLTFDDMVISENRNQVVATNMKAPYHHLFYGNGFTSIPDKWEPYPAISQPNVALFLPLSGRLLPNTAFAGTLLPGELGAGPRASVDAYWFNAYSAYFGCALNGLVACIVRISGYRYDAILKQEVLVAEQNATIPPCWGYINCRLRQVLFNDNFKGLSGIQFNAFTANLGLPEIHMMDDLQMEWYNNSCSAGILRLGHS